MSTEVPLTSVIVDGTTNTRHSTPLTTVSEDGQSNNQTAITYNPYKPRASTSNPNERSLSILDPFSDRVSTILVWQNLTVSTRPDKRKEFFQRLKSSKNFVPKRKTLLNDVSGAIAGGLWAVMGKISSCSV